MVRVPVTAKDFPTWTMSRLPSASLRCASYTPSLSVSTRSTVAVGYFATAAALTLPAVSPVSRCSSGRTLLV